MDQMTTMAISPSLKSQAFLGHHYKNFILSTIVINACMALVSVFLNLLVILIFVKTPSLREYPSNVLVLSLAISDFGVGIIVQPLFCVLNYFQLTDNIALGQTEKIFLCICYVLSAVSSLTLTAITIDRFLAVKLHLRYSELITTKRYGIALACIWIASSITVLKDVFDIPIFSIIVTVISCGIFFVNLYLLYKISQVIRRHSAAIEAQQQSVESVEQSMDMPRYKKSVKTMHYLIGAFVFCYVLFLGKLIGMNFELNTLKTREIEIVYCLAITFVMFNSVINPVIYCWRIEEMRNAAKLLIQNLWRQNDDN